MPVQQTPGPHAEAAPGTWIASNGSSSCGHTLCQSIWSWHTVLPHNMVREWRGHLSAGSWQRTGLLQRGLWWSPFPCAQKASRSQQTHVYCLEVVKNINKGGDQICKRQYWKMCSWTVTCLKDEYWWKTIPNADGSLVKLDFKLWLLWFLKPMMCWSSTYKTTDFIKPVQCLT